MFSQSMADSICARLAEGESLRAICRDEGMPSHTTVLEWAETPPFSDQYTRARARGYALVGDDILTIVDEPGDVADKRLRFDARRWMLSKMLPKVYGDKLDVEHKGTVSVTLPPEASGIL